MIMKIKTKKQLNLPQLIEWIEKNRSYGEVFTSDRYNCVHVNVDGVIEFAGTFYDDTFTVEVEEEVNGETILGRLYEVYFDGLKHDTNMFTNTTTNSLITSKTALIYTVIDNQVIVLWEKYTGGFR